MDGFKNILNNCSNHSKKICFLVLVLVSALVIVQIPFNKISGNLNQREILIRRQTRANKSVSEEFRSTIERRDNGRWYNFSTINFRLYAYSAFYDNRSSLLSLPVIRITAISDSHEELMKRKRVRLYCVLHHNEENIVVHMEEKPKPIGHGWSLNRLPAREYIYTCPVVNGSIPKSVSIITKQRQNPSSGVPVIIPSKPETKRDFCVCVQAVYGTLDPYRMIEWLELQKILGVSLVGVYILSAPDNVLKVLKHYSDEKFVDLRKISYIYSNNTGASEFWLHLTPAINDCIYRHMHEFKRMVVIDFDEFIMPRKHQNLSELVSYLDRMFIQKKSPHPNYDFRNNYFFLDLEADETVSKYLTFLRFRRKVEISGPGYSVKSIINPQACTHMHNHLCWGVTPNYTTYGISERIDPEIALNQHYKKCHFSRTECEEKMRNTTKDDIMLKFKDTLKKNINAAVSKIMGHEI